MRYAQRGQVVAFQAPCCATDQKIDMGGNRLPRLKRMLKGARRQWASATVEAALESFIRRKERELEHLRDRKARVVSALAAAQYPSDWDRKQWGL